MSNFTTFRQESTVEERKQVTVPQTTTYTYSRSERPEAYQYWHKKGKNNSYQSKVLSTHYKLQNNFNPGQSIQLGGGCGQQVQGGGCYTQNCCPPSQSAVVRLGVVSREEIEAPWREEVLYLQSLIADLEKRKQVQIVKEIDNTRVHELEDENEHLRMLISQAQSEVVTQRITEVNSEAEVWKKKFSEINHEFNETQEKLMNAEIELEALKKQKAATATATTTVTRSVVKTSSGSTVRQSGSAIKEQI